MTTLEDRWGWITEGADPGRLPDTLRRLEWAGRLSEELGDAVVLRAEIAQLSVEGAIRG